MDLFIPQAFTDFSAKTMGFRTSGKESQVREGCRCPQATPGKKSMADKLQSFSKRTFQKDARGSKARDRSGWKSSENDMVAAVKALLKNHKRPLTTSVHQ